MRKLLKGVAVAGLGLLLVAVPASNDAEAQLSRAVVTTVAIDFPEILIVHYYSSLDFALDQTALMNYVVSGSGGSGTKDEGTATNGAVDVGSGVDASLAATQTNDPSAAVLTMSNVWAVRAISSNGQTKASVNVDSSALPNGADDKFVISGGTTTLDVSSAQVGTGGSWSTGHEQELTFNNTGLAALLGHVRMTLDLADASTTGDYQTRYTLTVTNL